MIGYDDIKESIYLSYCIINIPEVKSREEELFDKGIYLPNLIRNVLSKDYFKRIDELGKFDDILPDLKKAYKYTREESCIEFINWVDSHKEYNSFINERELKLMGDELELLEEYDK